jgi:ubiquinone/menaquinone biosynthesis C-methylase UbiE
MMASDEASGGSDNKLSHKLWNESIGKFRSSVYDNVIVSFTSKWYADVLRDLPEGSRLLDVGIGTGAALIANKELIRSKNIKVVGVDYDADYIERCRRLISEANISDHVSAVCCSFYDFGQVKEKFDHIYFSGSFMILPDGPGAIRHAIKLLANKDLGRLYFTQTFELNKDSRTSSLIKWVKPTLKYWTTIDFGNVTYVDDFEGSLSKGGANVASSKRIEDGKAVEGKRETRLVVARAIISEIS